MEVSGRRYALAGLPPEKGTQVAIGYEAGSAPESVWKLRPRETFALPGIEAGQFSP
jgi:hypothetical protein